MNEHTNNYLKSAILVNKIDYCKLINCTLKTNSIDNIEYVLNACDKIAKNPIMQHLSYLSEKQETKTTSKERYSFISIQIKKPKIK